MIPLELKIGNHQRPAGGVAAPGVQWRIMMGKQEELNEIVIYDAPGRKIEVQVHTESLWLSLTQVAVVFGVNK
ncbi:MAG: hypothetical protein KKF28_05070, partial [Proteobacteria bacterium]|nr:hypothetical protein [Pseudomonadota bacterium]